MNAEKLSVLKGTTILIPFVFIFTYVNIDSIDGKLNINLVNSTILLLVITGLTVVSGFAVKALQGKAEEELSSVSIYKPWRIYIWAILLLTMFINLSITKHSSMLTSAENSGPFITLVLYIAILFICYKYIILNLAVFSTIINIPYVLSVFSFISQPILFGLYILFYVIAIYLLSELLKPNSKLLAKKTAI